MRMQSKGGNSLAFIHVEGLSKQFEYYKKELGLKNSIKNLYHREKLIKDAVCDINFDIVEGEFVGFLGPNGAGKTTTLKMLSGILYPTTGAAYVMGYVPWEREKEFKRQFSIVMGQKNQLWWDLPAHESFHLNKCIYELEDRAYQETLDELVELLEVRNLLDVQVRRLSLGERMKMELIAALIHRPKVIFLDEPTIGLDIISQKKIREFLKVYNKEKKATILLTSHYMNDIEDLCKRVIIINRGKLAYDGDLSHVNDLFSKNKIVKLNFEKVVAEKDLKKFGEVKAYEGLSTTLEINKQSLKEKLKQMLEILPIIDFNIEDIPIEEGIAYLYQKKEGMPYEAAK